MAHAFHQFKKGGGNSRFSYRKRKNGDRPSGFARKEKQGKKRSLGETLDVSQFIQKAVIIEEVERFVPEHRFSDFHFDERLKKNIAKRGYESPTPIQDHAMAHIIRGCDVVGIANTGTGKTAAFLLPLLNKVLLHADERVLIMVPTRELAQQIVEEMYGFTTGLRIHAALCVGGANIVPQIAALRRKPQFVIGTPGRLKDLLERRALVLSEFHNVVLDEADRMLDMGFIGDMRKILALMSTERQTLFFSATISREVENVVGEFLKMPVRVSVKTQEIAAGIEQDVVRVPSGKNKLDVLYGLLVQKEFSKVLIFCRTKHGVEKLAKNLIEKGVRAESIHGNKTQNRRERALDLFRRDHVRVLVATDVAARGLDITGVSHVINYDLPASHEDYVHRIGRTGRAGKRGKALTFIE